jgi:hypothetical protein
MGSSRLRPETADVEVRGKPFNRGFSIALFSDGEKASPSRSSMDIWRTVGYSLGDFTVEILSLMGSRDRRERPTKGK